MGERALRWRDVPRLMVTVVGEAVLVVVFWKSQPWLGSVDFSHFGGWIHATAPVDALTALVRVAGIAFAGWLLVTTVVYVVATVAGADGLVRRTRWVTLPVVRRMVDGLAAASIMATTMAAATSGGSLISSHPAAVVQTVPVSHRPGVAPRPRLPPPARTTSVGPVAVDETLVGRHLPHPGVLAHVLPASYTAPAPVTATGTDPTAGLAPGTKYVIVQPGDCLSVIAEQHLGDWRADTQIGTLNAGRVQPDGRTLTDDNWIYPGWVLVMPADATGTQVVPAAATATPGQPSKTAPITTQPPRPPSAPTTKVAPTPKPSVAARPAPATRSTAKPTPTTTAKPTPTTTANAPPAAKAPAPAKENGGHHPGATARPDRTPSSGDRAPSPAKEHRSRSHSVPVGPLVGVTGVVAAGVIWRLGRRRRDQMHDRPSGGSLPANPAPVVAAEARARAIADDEAMRWVDAGMRYLGGQLAADATTERIGADGAGTEPALAPARSSVPSVVLVRVGTRGMEIMIAPPRPDAPDGWQSVDDGTVWVLEPSIDLDDLEARAAPYWPLVPALISVGTTVDGVVLANMEHAGSLAVEGDPETVRGLLGQMLVELTSQPWADEMLAGLHALGDLGAQQLAGVAHDGEADPMAIAEVLDGIADRTGASLGDWPSVGARRAIDHEHLPHVAVAFADTPADVTRCLIEAAVPDRSSVAAVVAGAAIEARWRLTVDQDGHGSLSGWAGDRSFRLAVDNHINLETVGLLGQALSTSAEPADLSAPPDDPARPGQQRPDPGPTPNTNSAGSSGKEAGHETVDCEAAERGAVEIRLFGTMRVVGNTGSVEATRRDAPLAALAYLATRGRPAEVGELSEALWPATATKGGFGVAPKTVYNVISRARGMLGIDVDGEPRLTHGERGYALAPAVTSDWHRFQALVRQARTGPTVDAPSRYRAALELVEGGGPFASHLGSPFFEWVTATGLEYAMTAAVVDAADALAGLANHDGDHELAIWAVERGLVVDPLREQLYQQWMHALGRGGGLDRVGGVWDRLCAVLRERIDPTQEPTADSRAVYRAYVGREDARPGS